MLITRRSPISGKVTTRDIEVSQIQLDMWIAGTVIQKAMPLVSSADREFIMTGMVDEDWAIFKEM